MEALLPEGTTGSPERGIQLSECEIVGYADVLTEDLRPRAVTPVYRVTASPNTILMPPFRIQDGAILEAHVGTSTDWENLACSRLATALRQPITAADDRLLWIGKDGLGRYQPTKQALAALQTESRKESEIARHALLANQLGRAARHAQAAFSADETSLDAFLTLALVAHRQGDRGRAQVLGSVAKTAWPSLNLDSWIMYELGKLRLMDVSSKYRGLAAERPRAVQLAA